VLREKSCAEPIRIALSPSDEVPAPPVARVFPSGEKAIFCKGEGIPMKDVFLRPFFASQISTRLMASPEASRDPLAEKSRARNP
jgi:hypothetical protein